MLFCVVPPPTCLYTLSLHDALPISILALLICGDDLNVIALIGIILLIGIVKKNGIMIVDFALEAQRKEGKPTIIDRKSTRLNSSHLGISYAVFCLKKKSYSLMHSKW